MWGNIASAIRLLAFVHTEVWCKLSIAFEFTKKANIRKTLILDCQPSETSALLDSYVLFRHCAISRVLCFCNTGKISLLYIIYTIYNIYNMYNIYCILYIIYHSLISFVTDFCYLRFETFVSYRVQCCELRLCQTFLYVLRK